MTPRYIEEHPFMCFFGFLATVALCVAVSMPFLTQMNKVNAEASVEREKIVQREETEREEERQQFWQSLIPWGSNEAEEGK